jgi:hypothetical protein
MTWPAFRWSLALLGAAGLVAQGPGSERPVARVGRVAEANAPRIDGMLADACWDTAPAIGDLAMVEPWLRAPVQRTVVKLLHDRHHFYVAVWCFHADPASIRASQRARDARLDPDDRVEILLDPFENRRTAYFFQIGAGGSIGDILISANGSRFDKPWDAIWNGKSRLTDGGWEAEIAIPFRSLPRRDGVSRWGFNLARYVRATNEEYRWANVSQSVSFFRVSECGTIEGFADLDAGLGVELVPYVAAGAARDRRAADDGWDLDPDAGGEAYVRLSPSVTLATTVFTDFAETEDDGRQINLNRFPLFFPEKRDFFLEGGSYFTFGASEAGSLRFLPFFTRRIGLAGDGTQIPLDFGAKLTGEAGPFEVGLLDVQTGATDVVERENLAVARVKYAIDAQTTVGLLGTHGDPSSAGQNGVVGVDFYHRQPRFVGDLDLVATIDVASSHGNVGNDDGDSFGIDLRARGSEWEFAIGTRQVAADFLPALGFVERRDTRQSAFDAFWRPRAPEGSVLRRYLCQLAVERAESWAGEPQRRRVGFDQLGVELHSGDQIAAFVGHEFERVENDFTLFRGTATVAAGDYESTRAGLSVETSEGRSWNAIVLLSGGDFFGGESQNCESNLEWRTSALLHLGAGYSTAHVDLGPANAFTTHIGSGRLDLHFTPALSLRNLVQFDNESNLLGWQSRLRWIYAPGSDFFAVLGTAWVREDGDSFVPTEQTLEFKFAHSLRF